MEYTYKNICSILGLSPNGAYNKMNGKTAYTMPELIKMKRAFNMTYEQLFEMIDNYKVV